jgi:pyruvate/2-oxoglutarate dehydrogenase complex dihydrolipoamide acyltransferase (E2) component
MSRAEQSQGPGYTATPFPILRRFSVDAGWLGRRKHIMHGLLEFDVTEARRLIRVQKARTGAGPSFTAFLILCLARAIEQNKEVQAFLDWRGRLVVFDDISVTTMVEIDTERGKVVSPRMIHGVNRLTLREIHDSIRTAQKRPEKTREVGFMRWFLRLPGFVRRLFYVALQRSPSYYDKLASPVLVSSVGMFGKGGGWGIPMANFSLTVTVGGIAEKPGVVDGGIEVREYLYVTLSFDHDVVDGAPAARFSQHFRELVESAYGLVEEVG